MVPKQKGERLAQVEWSLRLHGRRSGQRKALRGEGNAASAGVSREHHQWHGPVCRWLIWAVTIGSWSEGPGKRNPGKGKQCKDVLLRVLLLQMLTKCTVHG